MNNDNVATRAALFANGKDRGAKLFVKSKSDGSPTAFKAIIAKAKQKKIISVAGGCKGLDDTTREAMFGFFASALTRADGSKFAGVVMSGGTKDAGEAVAYPGVAQEAGKTYVKGMVTQIPSYIAGQPGFDIIAVSHTPKTDDMSLKGDGASLVLNDYGNTLDAAGHHAMLVCQPDVNTGADWDFDCPEYLELLEQLAAEGWIVVQIAINGGDITRDSEIYAPLAKKIHTIVVDGSGREADAAAAVINTGDWSKTAAELRAKKGDAKADAKVAECQAIFAGVDKSFAHVVKMNDADALRAAFVNIGII